MNHPTALIKEPGGKSRFVAWFRQLRRNIRERTVIAGHGVSMDHTQDGVRISIAALRRAAGGAAEGVNFRGDWAHDSTYAEDDYVYVPGGYTTPTEYDFPTRRFTGLWKSKVSNSGVVPGTDDDKWERVAEGPRDGDEWYPDDPNDESERAKMQSYGLTIDNDGTFGSIGAGFLYQRDTDPPRWAIWMPAGLSGATLNINSTDLEGGEMAVRDAYVTEGGVLKQAKVLMTEPELVSLE